MIISKKVTKPTAITRYEDVFNTEFFKLDWKKIFVLPFRTTLSTKLREFQYKILNRILYTNQLLYKIGKAESPLCYFCQSELETLEHLLFKCPRIKEFWFEVYLLLSNQNIVSAPFDIKDIIFGVYESNSNVLLINQIILNGKYYIYCCKIKKSLLSRSIFLQKMKMTYYTEHFIARENNKLEYHCKKWEAFLPYIEDV